MTNDVAPDPTPDQQPGETPAELRRRKAAERRAAKAAADDAARLDKISDAPPKAPPTDRPKAGTKLDKRAAAARLALGVTAAGVTAFVNERDGEAIAEGAPALALALARLAEQNPRVAKALDMMTVSGAWTDVAMAVWPIALAIAANHGMFGIGTEQPAPQPTGAPPADPFGPVREWSAQGTMSGPIADDPATWNTVFTVRPDDAASAV